jgi:integrase
MATITRRGEYQWQVKIRRNGYPAQSKTLNTKAEAESWSRLIESEMDRGIFVSRSEAEKNTLHDLVDRYIKEVTPTKRSADSEKSRLLAMMERPICRYTIAALSNKEIASYRDQRGKEVSPATVNKELNLLAHIIETSRREWGINIPENPVRLVRRPKVAAARERRLTKNEETKLLKACRDARNPFLLPITKLAIETAMRQGEIVGLQWRHINLKKHVAHLPTTKNGEARSVPLSSVAIGVLRALPRSIDGMVFPGVTTEAVKRAFKRACKRAKINDFRFHDLRHEGTSRLFEKGLNLMQVAEITGHKTLQMLKRYTHLQAGDLAKMLG